MTPAQRSECRRRITACILATDLARHFELMTKLETRLDSGVPYEPTRDEDRADVCVLLLKTADVSNVAKPWPTALRWANALAAEFFRQGDEERAMGLLVSPHCDPTKTNAGRSSMAFIDAIAGRLFALVGRLLAPHGEQLVTNVAANRFMFQQQLAATG